MKTLSGKLKNRTPVLISRSEEDRIEDRLEQDRQRIDKWLWYARVVKSRTLATKLVEDGHVRLNGKRLTVAARVVGIGDVLTIALERQVRVLRVIAIVDRRGPSREACLLFEDLTGAQAPCA